MILEHIQNEIKFQEEKAELRNEFRWIVKKKLSEFKRYAKDYTNNARNLLPFFTNIVKFPLQILILVILFIG